MNIIHTMIPILSFKLLEIKLLLIETINGKRMVDKEIIKVLIITSILQVFFYFFVLIFQVIFNILKSLWLFPS
jgi:hypothetical protein